MSEPRDVPGTAPESPVAVVDVMELAERVVRDNGPYDKSDEGALAHALLQTAQDKAYYLQRSDRLGAAETQMRAAVLWLERRTRYEGSRREDCVQYAESHARAALHLAGFTEPWRAMTEVATATMTFRVERTEYADIEVDVPALFAEWSDYEPEGKPVSRELVVEVLKKIGARDLMYGGDFITVLDDDTEESIT